MLIKTYERVDGREAVVVNATALVTSLLGKNKEETGRFNKIMTIMVATCHILLDCLKLYPHELIPKHTNSIFTKYYFIENANIPLICF